MVSLAKWRRESILDLTSCLALELWLIRYGSFDNEHRARGRP